MKICQDFIFHTFSGAFENARFAIFDALIDANDAQSV